MLREKTKSITLKANSAVEVTEADGTTKLVNVEGYTCTINSDNPVDISIGKYFASTQAKALYKVRNATRIMQHLRTSVTHFRTR